MKKQAMLFALALSLGGAIVLGPGAPDPGPAEAAKGGDPGPPDDGTGEVPDYGDLIILLRDTNGVPIPSDYPVPVPNPETEDPEDTVNGGMCWQPIGTGEFPTSWSAPEDRTVSPDGFVEVDGGWLIPVDQYNCAIEAEFATYAQEVEFGRTNEARSPVTVFESQLEDVRFNLATADFTSLDPAGRMVASTCYYDEVGDVVTTTGTIDSPLQSLAIYRQLMLTGDIGVSLPQEADVLDTAARALGTASDKGGEVNVDMVAYVNAIMGLDVAPTILGDPLTETYREEVQGVIQPVTKQFLNYGAFGYNRGANFGTLPAPAYIGSPATAGWFEYLTVATAAPNPTFTIAQGPITTAVFSDTPGVTSGNIAGFAQAADDTRAVINFMHDWPIPDADVYGTPVPCEPPEVPLAGYDVSISDVSGLQVPAQMVDGSEGREFIVTVANAGPDPATGTVTVTATASNDTLIVDSPWTFPFTDVAAGASESFNQVFWVELGHAGTVDWTAVVEAPYDVDPNNNTVAATTSVKVTGGGGGGGRP